MIYVEDDVVFCLGIKLYSVLSLVSLLSKQGNSAEVPVLLWQPAQPRKKSQRPRYKPGELICSVSLVFSAHDVFAIKLGLSWCHHFIDKIHLSLIF